MRSSKGSSNSIVEDAVVGSGLEASDSSFSASLSVVTVDVEELGISEVEDDSGRVEVVVDSRVVETASVGSGNDSVSAFGNSVVAAWLVVDSVCVVVVDSSDDEVVVDSVVVGINVEEEEVVA